MSAMSSARQSEVKAWEEEIEACEHTLTLEQHLVGAIPPTGTPSSLHAINGRQLVDAPKQNWLLMIFGSRIGPLFRLRTDREPLALPNLRIPWMWPSTIRRHRRKRTRTHSLPRDQSSSCCQAGDYHC